MKRILAVVALGSLAAPAFAGGPVVVTPEPEVIPAVVPVVGDRGGEWGGFYGGAQIGYGKVDGDASGVRVIDGDGAIGGVQAGYRWDFGKTVLGVEAAYLGGNVKDDSADAKLKHTADLKLQLGYDMGRSLIYATAGGSWAKARVAGTDYSDNGWNVGLGYDYDLGNNWLVGAEYLHRRMDNFDNTGTDLKADTFTIRANYRF